MKTIIVFGIYGALWAPGIWLAGYITNVYGSEGHAPFMLFAIECGLILYPWYFAIGPGNRYIDRFLKFIHVDLDD